VGSDEYVSRCDLKGNNEQGSYPTSICAVVIVVVGAGEGVSDGRVVCCLRIGHVEGQGSSRGFGLSKFEARAVSPTKLSERLRLSSAF